MHVQLGGQAPLESSPYQIQRGLARRERAPCDVRLPVELEQVEVGLGEIADQRGQHRPAVLLAREELRARRLRGPPKPPPQVHLERQIGARAVEVLVRVDPRARPQGVQGEALLGESLVAVARLTVQLWELCCARDAELRPRLPHACDGEVQVLVLSQRLADQLLQHRVREDLPPVEGRPAILLGRSRCATPWAPARQGACSPAPPRNPRARTPSAAREQALASSLGPLFL